jgi:hypothetical protein
MQNSRVFNRDSTNIVPITNLDPGGERAHTLHTIHSDYVVIRSELKYSIGAQLVKLKFRDFGVKTSQIPTVQVFMSYDQLQQFGSRSEPVREPTLQFGTVDNTTRSIQTNCIIGTGNVPLQAAING